MYMIRLILILAFIPTLCFGQWTQLGDDIDGQVANEQSGFATSMNATGTIVIVGAPAAMDAGITKGKARVLEWGGASWIQKGPDLVGTSQGDVFGDAVSISADGNIIAVGAPGFQNPSQPPGYTRVYEWNGTSWVQKGNDITGEAGGNTAGTAVSLSSDGSTIAIGAGLNSNANGNFSGHCRVYTWNGTSWVQKGADIDGEAAQDFSGNAVSIDESGNIVAIGAAGNDGAGTTFGHVRVYEWNGTSWVQKGADIDGENLVRSFGRALSIDANGSTFISSGWVGSNGSRGSIKIFSWNGTNWVQKGATLTGDNGSDFFGTSVDINGDGSMVIGGTTGNTGYAKVFSFIGGEWVQQGPNIPGEASGDQFGRSVSMDNDGSIVAVGTPYNDGNGSDAGHVRVFQSTSTLPVALAYFTGNYSDNAALLNWKVENQINFSHFVVERSLDGSVFSSLKDIQSANSAFYNYKDTDLKRASICYYRLKMVDNDGTFSYSNIISIRTGGVSTFSVLGNPVNDNLNITGLEAGASITLYDNTGNMILQKSIQDQSLLMDISFLSSGVYYLQYVHDRIIENKKIIKQ